MKTIANRMMKIKYLLTGFIVLTSFLGATQVYFMGGYGLSRTPIKDVNRMIYISNQIQDKTQDMKYLKWSRGIHLGVGMSDVLGLEIKYSRKTARTSDIYTDAGVTYNRELYIRNGVFSFNFFGGSDEFNVGMGVDFGQMKGWGRTYAVGTEKPDETLLFAFDSSVPDSPNKLLSSTVGLSWFGEAKITSFLWIRLTYYWQMGGVRTQNVGHHIGVDGFGGLLGAEDGMGGFTLDLSIKIGGND